MKAILLSNEVDTLAVLAGYQHPELVERIRQKLALDAKEAEKLFADMKKYLYLCATSNEKLAPTPKIDAAWHEFLMFTRDYRDFCQKNLGAFVHHTPTPALTLHEVLDPKRTFELAGAKFGSLSSNWQSPVSAECSPDSDCHGDSSCGGDV